MSDDERADRPEVLVVEDDPSTLELTVTYLDVGGIRASTATSGEEALRILETHVPELIISDVDMEGMDGYELCRRVREKGLDDIPFIFVSALGSLPQRIKGLKVGADDYLPKPVDPEELILKVQTLIQRNRRVLARLKQASELTPGGVMKGHLGEIEITALLQLFDLADTGDVHIRLTPPQGRPGEIYISDGLLKHVTLGELTGERAFFRVLQIEKGEFEVQRKAYDGEPTLSAPVQRALLDGVAKVDEYRRLVKNLGSESDSFRINESVKPQERSFEEPVARVLTLVDELHDLDEILEASPVSELETLRILAELQQARVILEE